MCTIVFIRSDALQHLVAVGSIFLVIFCWLRLCWHFISSICEWLETVAWYCNIRLVESINKSVGPFCFCVQ